MSNRRVKKQWRARLLLLLCLANHIWTNGRHRSVSTLMRLLKPWSSTTLNFSPVWGLEPHFSTRDATVWYYDILVESAQHLIGILAGLNKLYFTTFQFKRMGKFTEKMSIKPQNLYTRIEGLFKADLHTAVSDLEQLVAELY